MSANQWIWLGLAVVFALLALLVMAIDTALSSMTKARVDVFVEEGRKNVARLKDVLEDPAPTLTAVTLLRVIFEIVSIVLFVMLIFSLVEPIWLRLLITIAVLSIISFTMWWTAPRTLGKLHDEKLALGCLKPVGFISSLVWPIGQVLIWVTNALTPGPGWTDGPASPEAEKIEVASDGERQMIRSVFELGDTLVREVMVPRTDVVYIEQEKTVDQGLSLALRSGFSRIPVIANDLDDIVGILYVKDAMSKVYRNPELQHTVSIAEVMREPKYVPDSKPIDELLREMQLTRNHMVVVVDEFGGTSGLATIEDLVEEIVGEITDEYDSEPDLAQEVEPGLWRVSARMPIDDTGSLFDLDVDDEDVETIGGLLAKELNMVPIPGSSVTWNGLELTAERTTARRHQIDTILVRKLEPAKESEGE